MTKVKDRVPSRVKRQTRIRIQNLGTTAKQVAMVWACVVKKDNDWVKKCMKYKEEGSRP